MEERLGIRLIERQVGGRNGGGASLTDEAKMFLRQYGELEQDIERVVNERFRRIFHRNGQ